MISIAIRPGQLTQLLRGGQMARLAWLVNLLLVLWVAYQIAQMTWLLIPDPDLPVAGVRSEPAVNEASTAKPKFEQIVGWHLFGQAKTVELTPEQPIQVPETPLNLKLMGVLSSNEKDQARAIIADARGDQQSYGVGAQLPGDAELTEIHADRVILMRNQRQETLRLEQLTGPHAQPEPQTRAPGGVTPKSVTNVRLNEPASALLETYREKLETAPVEVVAAFRPVPATRGGQFIGFRLGGNRNNELLKNIGLQPGDIVTEVNGIKFTEMSKGMEAVEKLQGEKHFDITVSRGEQNIQLSVDVP